MSSVNLFGMDIGQWDIVALTLAQILAQLISTCTWTFRTWPDFYPDQQNKF